MIVEPVVQAEVRLPAGISYAGSEEPRTMNEVPENSHQAADSAPDERPWQYSLRSLFVLTTIVAVLCSLARSLGPFVLLFPLLLLPAWDIMQTGDQDGRRGSTRETQRRRDRNDRPQTQPPPFPIQLRTLLVVVMLCAIPCSWLSVELRRYERQWEAGGKILKLGGKVILARPLGPGSDFVTPVEFVDLTNTQARCRPRKSPAFWRLEKLSLSGTHVTDDGLQNLQRMNQLQELELQGTQVTDAGRKKLQQALPKCQITKTPSSSPGW